MFILRGGDWGNRTSKKLDVLLFAKVAARPFVAGDAKFGPSIIRQTENIAEAGVFTDDGSGTQIVVPEKYGFSFRQTVSPAYVGHAISGLGALTLVARGDGSDARSKLSCAFSSGPSDQVAAK